MDDAAAFKATYAGLRSLTDGDFRISFDFPGEKLKEVTEVLTQGGKPSAASGTWFAIARLNIGGAALTDGRVPTTALDHNATNDSTAAPGLVTKTSPARSLSQDAFLLCNRPTGRVYLEQRRRHAIPAANHINSTDEAKHVLRAWLRIESLSELDRDPRAAAEWEKIEADYKMWLTAAKYVPEPGDYM